LHTGELLVASRLAQLDAEAASVPDSLCKYGRFGILTFPGVCPSFTPVCVVSTLENPLAGGFFPSDLYDSRCTLRIESSPSASSVRGYALAAAFKKWAFLELISAPGATAGVCTASAGAKSIWTVDQQKLIWGRFRVGPRCRALQRAARNRLVSQKYSHV
jgi:hypothetical protein